MDRRFGGRRALQQMISEAIHQDSAGLEKEAAARAAETPQATQVDNAWIHDPEAIEKMASGMEFMALNLGTIVDDRSPVEKMAEEGALRGLLHKVASAAGPQPPTSIGSDTTSFPATPGDGIPVDLHQRPGGDGAQPYTLDAAIPKLVPKMKVPDAKSKMQPNLGSNIPTDEERAQAPGTAAGNPLYDGPKGPGYMKKNAGARGAYIRSLLKVAQDPSSPQPQITGKVGGSDPQVPGVGYFATPSEVGVPPVGSDPSNATRSAIANNEAPVKAKPRDLSVKTQRPEVAKLLSEPMQSAAHDSKVRENLGKIEAAAGPKLASVSPSMAKTAAARALLKKLASEGAETGKGPENKTGTEEDEEKEMRAKKLAGKAGLKAKEEKTSMFGAGGPSPMVAGPGVVS